MHIFPLWLALLFGNAAAPNHATREPEKKYRLVWADEFDYTGLPDAKKWSYDVGGHGWGNQELEFYTKDRLENARVENGLLVIEARKEKYENNDYTSARLVTKGKGDWQYGRVEVRAKLPQGRGTWPAVWMLASTTPLKWPDDGELDIMEHVGFDPGVVHANVHTKAYNHAIKTNKGNRTTVPDATTAFHTYRMDWNAKQITFYVDEKPYFTFANDKRNDPATWPYDQKFHLLLNIAVGGAWGGQQGVDDSVFPQRMEVDYVRIYQ
ncbi:MAG: glycoside hydrolase family 16 protein [Cytophagales bacterium]|nr:glycoside hydrolase family 16 protein [Cytophagales bacterium]